MRAVGSFAAGRRAIAFELTVLGRGPALLRFGGAEVAVGNDAVSYTYRIRGGVLSLGERGTFVCRRPDDTTPSSE